MPIKRRNFVKSLGLLATAFPFANYDIFAENKEVSNDKNPKFNEKGIIENDVKNEDFWNWVHSCYTVNPNILNLNNGGVSPQPKIVQDAFEQYYELSNEGPSYFMWRILDQGREPLRQRLAELAGVSPEEIAINRNTTEALDTVIFGLNLKKGDEVVLTKQDYPNVINAFKQREMRDGIVLKWVNLNLPMENEDEIVNAYKQQFTDKTKLVNITHIINWTGQIIPARKIANVAHSRGIEVMVDGAHSFVHFDYKISDLDCDYFGTSLHKWLCAPFGTGLLYVKKEKIKSIYPLFPNPEPLSDDIRKFEAQGTRNFAAEQAIGQAINFHQIIGSKRKEERLRFLKNYWAEKVLEFPKVKLHTSLKPEYSCGIALFSIEGKKPADVASILFDKFKIHTVSIEWENISGVRVTPNVYTRLQDLDKFINAVEYIARS
ncbi:MAG: aminotransferase class V-fold PLP-dependent enzyme [Candidatus Kapaibacteriota bacterium]